MQNPLLLPIALLIAFVAAIAMSALVRAAHARRRRRNRVLEKPNSHHTWERVREIETRDRWSGMSLEPIHPVNRDEVLRLLGKVQISGADSLRPQERRFLDQMAEISGAGPPAAAPTAERPDRATPGTPDLRHRTT
jgi:hypothetical protein